MALYKCILLTYIHLLTALCICSLRLSTRCSLHVDPLKACWRLKFAGMAAAERPIYTGLTAVYVTPRRPTPSNVDKYGELCDGCLTFDKVHADNVIIHTPIWRSERLVVYANSWCQASVWNFLDTKQINYINNSSGSRPGRIVRQAGRPAAVPCFNSTKL